VSLSDDLPPRRRPLILPVAIATVFLAVIGVSVGFSLGNYHRRTVPAGMLISPRPTQPADQGPAPSQPQESQTSTGPRCPEEAEATAQRLGLQTPLYQVLKVRRTTVATYVWICRDGDDRLFYQSKTGGETDNWEEGTNALFLSGVVRGDSGYEVTAADGNTFKVNTSTLTVTRKGKETTEYPVEEQ
jgi:hypothetical protein